VSRSPTLMVCTYCGFEARAEDLKLR
jgi:hypothetical protein